MVYSLLVTVFLLAQLPRYVLGRLIRGRYRGVFLQRLGFLPRQIVASSESSPIWIHAVSVGEANAVRPLLSRLAERHAGKPIVLSTVTDTGQEIARSLVGPEASFYFPIDLRFCCRRSIRAVRPGLVLLMETEIWPNFLRELNRHGVPVALINGRLSDRSFPRYRLARRWLRPVLANVTAFLVQTEADANRFRKIGAPADRIVLTGSLKFDVPSAGDSSAHRSAWRDALGLRKDELAIVAGSTFDGEEEILIRVWQQLLTRHSVRLVLAPRHPERFDLVARLLERIGVAYSRRSRLADSPGTASGVVLLDTIGELSSVYAAADIAFVGKSLCGVGGQNPLEPAAHGVPVVFGPHMENFREAAEILLSSGGAVQVHTECELLGTLQLWCEQSTLRHIVGENGLRALREHQGAVERTLAYLERAGLI